MNSLLVSVNPSYICNFDCGFCYLKGLHDSPLLDLKRLKNIFTELSKKYSISGIDIYGGQIFMLSVDYLRDLFDVCRQFSENINVISNFSLIEFKADYITEKQKLILENNIHIFASWDYIFREKYVQSFNNIRNYVKNYKKNITLLMTSPKLYEMRKQIVQFLNQSDFSFSVNVKPYYKTSNTEYDIDFKSYQKFVLYLYSNLRKDIDIIIDRNDFHTKHIFISPSGEIQDIFYDMKGQQYFRQKTDIDDDKIINQCIQCLFYNSCCRQHQFIHTEYDCCGQKKLLQKISALGKRMPWKQRRQIYYLTADLNDIGLKYKYDDNNIVSQVIEFFKNGSDLIYPAKSYYVAIIYAYYINQYFGQDFYEMLDMPDLLNFDDVYFKRYSQDKKTYDNIIQNINIQCNNIKDTLQYFFKQFLINI